MKLKRISQLLVAFSLLVGNDVLSQSLSLDEAVEYMLDRNEKVKQYKAKVEEKKYEEKAAWGNFLPTVNALGGYTYLSENVKINGEHLQGSVDEFAGEVGKSVKQAVEPVIGGLPPNLQHVAGQFIGALSTIDLKVPNLEIDKQDILTANIVALQPLYLGGKVRAGLKYAKAEHRTAEIELEHTEHEMTREVIQQYLGVALLKQAVDTRERVLKGMRQHETNAKKLIGQGVIPQHYLLRAKVAVADAEQELDDNKNKLDLAWMALKTTLGFPVDTVLTLSDSLHFKIDPTTLDFAKNAAISHQPMLRLIDQKELMVKQKLNVKRSEFLPKIFAFGEYGFNREDLPIIQPPAMVGVQLKFNIFNGFKDVHEYKAAKQLSSQVAFARNYAKKRVNLWVTKSYKEVLNAKDKYKKLGHTIDLAGENLRLNDRRFKEGMATSLEVIDARLMLQGAELKRLSALYEYYIALSELHLASGQPEKVIEILK
ncbi:MAG: TolC family protein [Hyphomicrobiales bacterium]